MYGRVCMRISAVGSRALKPCSPVVSLVLQAQAPTPGFSDAGILSPVPSGAPFSLARTPGAGPAGYGGRVGRSPFPANTGGLDMSDLTSNGGRPAVAGDFHSFGGRQGGAGLGFGGSASFSASSVGYAYSSSAVASDGAREPFLGAPRGRAAIAGFDVRDRAADGEGRAAPSAHDPSASEDPSQQRPSRSRSASQRRVHFQVDQRAAVRAAAGAADAEYLPGAEGGEAAGEEGGLYAEGEAALPAPEVGLRFRGRADRAAEAAEADAVREDSGLGRGMYPQVPQAGSLGRWAGGGATESKGGDEPRAEDGEEEGGAGRWRPRQQARQTEARQQFAEERSPAAAAGRSPAEAADGAAAGRGGAGSAFMSPGPPGMHTPRTPGLPASAAYMSRGTGARATPLGRPAAAAAVESAGGYTFAPPAYADGGLSVMSAAGVAGVAGAGPVAPATGCAEGHGVEEPYLRRGQRGGSQDRVSIFKAPPRPPRARSAWCDWCSLLLNC